MGSRGKDFSRNLGQRAARVERSDRPLPDCVGKTHMFNRRPLKIIGLIIQNTEKRNGLSTWAREDLTQTQTLEVHLVRWRPPVRLTG